MLRFSVVNLAFALLHSLLYKSIQRRSPDQPDLHIYCSVGQPRGIPLHLLGLRTLRVPGPWKLLGSFEDDELRRSPRKKTAELIFPATIQVVCMEVVFRYWKVVIPHVSLMYADSFTM